MMSSPLPKVMRAEPALTKTIYILVADIAQPVKTAERDMTMANGSSKTPESEALAPSID